jgi:hypothetical protein
MWLLFLLLQNEDLDADSIGLWLRFFVGLLLPAAGALIYRNRRQRHPILEDKEILSNLTPEQRLRLELKLGEHAEPASPLDPAFVQLLSPTPLVNLVGLPSPPQRLPADNRIAQLVDDLVAESRAREQGAVQQLKPLEQAELRRRIDAVLREKWNALAAHLDELGRDSSGAGWPALLAGETGIPALRAELVSGVQEAKRQGSVPALALQLEGPLDTLQLVLKHAAEATAEGLAPESAERIRRGVLHYIHTELPITQAHLAQTDPALDVG